MFQIAGKCEIIMVMYRLTFLGPALEMHAGGFPWKQGEPRVLDKATAGRLVSTYRCAEWELEEIKVEPELTPEPSKRRGRQKTEPAPVPEAEAEVTLPVALSLPEGATEEEKD